MILVHEAQLVGLFSPVAHWDFKCRGWGRAVFCVGPRYVRFALSLSLFAEHLCRDVGQRLVERAEEGSGHD